MPNKAATAARYGLESILIRVDRIVYIFRSRTAARYEIRSELVLGKRYLCSRSFLSSNFWFSETFG